MVDLDELEKDARHLQDVADDVVLTPCEVLTLIAELRALRAVRDAAMNLWSDYNFIMEKVPKHHVERLVAAITRAKEVAK